MHFRQGKNWIGFVSGFKGSLTLNDCARDVISAGRSSLLAIGVESVVGDFEAGHVLQLRTLRGMRLLAEYLNSQAVI
jgi:glutamate 5-kinase